jgi:hypothetical protein
MHLQTLEAPIPWLPRVSVLLKDLSKAHTSSVFHRTDVLREARDIRRSSAHSDTPVQRPQESSFTLGSVAEIDGDGRDSIQLQPFTLGSVAEVDGDGRDSIQLQPFASSDHCKQEGHSPMSKNASDHDDHIHPTHRIMQSTGISSDDAKQIISPLFKKLDRERVINRFKSHIRVQSMMPVPIVQVQALDSKPIVQVQASDFKENKELEKRNSSTAAELVEKLKRKSNTAAELAQKIKRRSDIEAGMKEAKEFSNAAAVPQTPRHVTVASLPSGSLNCS